MNYTKILSNVTKIFYDIPIWKYVCFKVTLETTKFICKKIFSYNTPLYIKKYQKITKALSLFFLLSQ